MVKLTLIPESEFKKVKRAKLADQIKLRIAADMCRANALMAVKIAGSGHLGSSFSAMDIVVYLYYKEMNTIMTGFDNEDRDVYFSSKGHDVPGLYSVFYSLGVLPKEMLLKIRRFGGLDGHPDRSIPGIECNSGSLGMGISKARGIAFAKKLKGYGGRVFVLTGDGELQEGQIYEALQTTRQQGINNLTVIIDHNKVQSDKLVQEIVDLGNLERKMTEFGWYVRRCDGHDFEQIEGVMKDFSKMTDRPKILIADTIKGRGVSFMEHPKALEEGEGLYRWHAGAPDDNSYISAHAEIIERINRMMIDSGIDMLVTEDLPAEKKSESGVSSEYVAEAFGEALLRLGEDRNDLVVLDADLAADCRIRKFEEKYPERFIENGIAEQDMVSMAGGLALQGLLPVVNSFSSFLASRANEQIYTNTGEGTRIIYACHYAGLIPAGPGKSHQSVRDISLFGALNNFEILQPANAEETHMIVDYCINESKKNCMIRINIGPSPRIIQLPDDYQLKPGRGVVLKDGDDAILFSYGPVMLHEALNAGEILKERQFGLRVVSMPWLNLLDVEWFKSVVRDCQYIFVLEDHTKVGGLADNFFRSLIPDNSILINGLRCFGVEGELACGTPPEALKHHGLDGESLADRILETVE